MKTEEIQSLFEEYEQAACEVNQVECQSARDLQKLLDYCKWENFSKVVDKAKDLVQMQVKKQPTIFLTSGKWSNLVKDLQGESAISKEHIDNNTAIRQMLIQCGIVPENLPPAEDVKKVERRLVSQ